MSKIKRIILSSILLAILIILSRFISIKTPILVISISFIPIMTSRIITQIVMLSIQIVIIYLLEKFTRPFVKKYLYEEI